jgi:hypothetical protein
MDQLPYLQADNESEGSATYMRFLRRPPFPRLESLRVGGYCFFVDSHGSPHNQDAEDFQAIMTRSCRPLRDFREPSTTTVIESLEEYIARIATNCRNLIAKGRQPKFIDKEKIDLEIYAERHNDADERERLLGMARGEFQSQEREASSRLAVRDAAHSSSLGIG